MRMDEKCELTSKILDYVWTSVLRKEYYHSEEKEEDIVTYIDEAQEIFNKILDIIDEETSEKCVYGNDTVAVKHCEKCGVGLCSFCGYSEKGKTYCNACYCDLMNIPL